MPGLIPGMTITRRLILAFALIAGISPAFAQAPPPVPALPDTERRTTYNISGSTCACAVGFQLYGDSTDYANWLEVFVNGAMIPQSGNWTITSPTGSLATVPRPITDAVLTFNSAQTGTVQIVGARRPRRTSQFSESRGVAARDLNQVLSDIIAQNRETWDKTNDVSGRAVLARPGETLALLPALASRANQGACFDSGGNLTSCISIPSGAIVAGNGIAITGGNPATITNNIVAGAGIQLSGTNPITIAATQLSPSFTQNGTGAVAQTFDQLYRAKIVTPEMYGAKCDGSDDGPAIQRAVTYAGTIRGSVHFAACSYTIVTPIVDTIGVELRGDHTIGTQLIYAPTTTPTIMFRVRNAGVIIVGGGIYNMRILSNDTTRVKTAIEIEDTSRYIIRDVSIQGIATSFWEGGGASIGLRTRGREFTWVKNLVSAADLPIVISDNPNSSIDSDWANFENLYLLTNGVNPSINIESGVNFTHMSFSDVSCVLGSYCLLNNDTTATQTSVGLHLSNFGAEQGVSGAAHTYLINRPASGVLYNLTIDGFQVLDHARNGIYLRNTYGTRLSAIFYDGTGQCLDTDATARGLSWSGSTFVNCSLTSFTNQTKVWSDLTPAGFVLPMNAVYAPTGGNVASFMTNARLTPLAVAASQACNAGNEGMMAAFTDGNTATWGTAVAGGGANHVLAYCNGTSWTVAGK